MHKNVQGKLNVNKAAWKQPRRPLPRDKAIHGIEGISDHDVVFGEDYSAAIIHRDTRGPRGGLGFTAAQTICDSTLRTHW